jgi:serine protease
VLDVDPARLDFAPSGVTTTVLTVSKSGDGDLPAAVAVSESASWLIVTEGVVDPTTKLGIYLATIDPSMAATGAYTGSITFTAGSQEVTVPVTMTVGGSGGGGDAGHVYFLLIDQSFNVVDVHAADAAGGAYPYSFPVSAGTYFVVAGSDLDGDEWICEPGEACGAYPTGDLFSEIPVSGDRTGLDFSIGFDAAIGAGAVSWLPPEGLSIRGPAAARKLR